MSAACLHVLCYASLPLVIILCVRYKRVRSKNKVPPGPPGLPFIGNVLDLPKEKEWLAYEQWGKLYNSDIVHLKIFQEQVFVLNTVQATKELFERRSNIYSDRVHMVMLHELTGWHRNVGFMKYDDTWRRHRRAFHQHFRPQAIPVFHAQMLYKVRELLGFLNDAPTEFLRYFRYMAGSLTLDISYGLEISPGDPILEIAEKGARTLFQITNAGAYLVDSLPILKHLPMWFPGAGFKRQAARWKKLVDAIYYVPFNQAKLKWERNELNPSLAANLFKAIEEKSMNNDASAKDLIINVAGIGYAVRTSFDDAHSAGTDTTVSALETFILAMLLYPDSQVKAYEQIDRHTRSERLPDLNDKSSLPYVTAIMKEVLRWRPVIPLAVPHKSTADDVYKGYFIPKGSIIIGNSWAILHDADRYPNPDRFDPTRFLSPGGELNPDAPDPIETFGYGRRICPGRYFAEDILWLTIANILAAFAVEKAVNIDGMVIEPKEEFTTGFFSIPVSVAACFKPHSEQTKTLIRTSATME